MRIILAAGLWMLVLASSVAAQQNSAAETDVGPALGHEMLVWTGVGADPIGTNGVTQGNIVWTAGARYGWILTEAHGPGALRGRFEYAMDAVPMVLVFQPVANAYGFAFVPWVTKWNFERHGRVQPYIEIGGGALISARQIPSGAGRFNFMPTGAVGFNLLRGKYHWSVEFRYLHISDASLTAFNPGTDTFGIRVGWGKFTHRK